MTIRSTDEIAEQDGELAPLRGLAIAVGGGLKLRGRLRGVTGARLDGGQLGVETGSFAPHWRRNSRPKRSGARKPGKPRVLVCRI